MGAGLQRHMLLAAVERAGVDPQTVDADALIDDSVSLPENIRSVERQLGIRLSVKDENARWARAEFNLEEWQREAEDRWTAERAPGGADANAATGTVFASTPEPPPASMPVEPTVGQPSSASGGAAAPAAGPSPPPVEPDARLVDAARRLAQNPDYRDSLRRLVAYEDAATDDFEKKYGWEASKVPVPYHLIRPMKDAALIRVGYQSNRYTNYLLTDREAVRRALASPDESPSADAMRVDVPQDRLAEFAEIAASGAALERLAPLVAPHVHDLLRAKQALLLVLASADDEGVSRARIHAMFWGPPGTAKTELLLWAANVAGCEVYSPRMTGPGLTVDLRTGEPGALPRAHATEWRLVCADEVEKYPPAVLRQTLQALEEGAFSYTAAGATGTMRAEIRFLGAANETENLPPEFLDRMDFLTHIPLPTRDAAREIVRSITDSFMRPGAERQAGFIRDYLRWARRHKPEFPDAERDLVGRVLAMFVDLHGGDAVRIRPYESILRVAYALSRLECGDVTGERVVRAVEVLHPDLNGGKVHALRQLVEATRRRSKT